MPDSFADWNLHEVPISGDPASPGLIGTHQVPSIARRGWNAGLAGLSGTLHMFQSAPEEPIVMRSGCRWNTRMFQLPTRGPGEGPLRPATRGDAAEARGILRTADGQPSEANPSGRGSSVGRARD